MANLRRPQNPVLSPYRAPARRADTCARSDDDGPGGSGWSAACYGSGTTSPDQRSLASPPATPTHVLRIGTGGWQSRTWRYGTDRAEGSRMQDLTLVGVHDDGDHLVLGGPDGQRYLLKVDEPLRAAVRRDRARLGRLQIEQAGTLRPRDIQAMIRAGRTAEDVAAEAGVPVEHVRRYEGPVLAEREFVSAQARGGRVRRAPPGAPGSWPTLDELVTQRLAAREVDAATASWDAWRTEGTWFIRLTFPAAGRERRAEWSYDVQLRHVTPLDDEARWFVDEPSPAAAAGPLPGPGRRALAPVRDGRDQPAGGGTLDGPVRERVYDVEADGGLRQVEDERAGAAAPAGDRLDTVRERRGRRQWVPDSVDDTDTPDALERAVDQLRVRAEALGEAP